MNDAFVDGVLFVTGDLEFPHLAVFARNLCPDIKVAQAKTTDDLALRLAELPPRTRMIAVATSVIVPADILGSLLLTPYNFHPGAPDYPGRYPESFAVYDGVRVFGATAHVMLPRVDEGTIVGVEMFDVEGTPDRLAMADLAYQAMIRLFARLVPGMLVSDEDLPGCGIRWGGIKRTRADFLAMRRITEIENPAERARRMNAFGEDSD